MDILRKMFKNEGMDDETNNDTTNSFRKPQWFEETETDDELFDDNRKFAFQIFTNPLELQKHFEQQLQQILDSTREFDENERFKVDKNLKDDFLKPGFESNILKEFEKHKKSFIDTDLDGEIYADQLHSLMQRLTTNNKGELNENVASILPRNDSNKNQKLQSKKKLTDEENILGQIHGTVIDDNTRVSQLTRPRTDIMPIMPRSAATPFGGVFEGTYNGPKMFSQSIMTKTTRKPDGSYETTKVMQDSQGNKTTTVTRTINGKSETITTYDNIKNGKSVDHHDSNNDSTVQIYSDRNIYVSNDGYALPRNIW